MLQSLIDEISELVYVVDPQTHELLFINQAGKRMFGLRDSVYEGKKCYRLLQGRDNPCDFCPNALLNQDSFYIWEMHNPIVNRHFIYKDKQILWEGKPAKIEIALDITEQEEQKKALEKALEIQELILDCVRDLHQMQDNNDVISLILKKLGVYLKTDRVCIYQSREDRVVVSHQWYREGKTPFQEEESLAPVRFSRWQGQFRRGKCVFIDNLSSARACYPEEYEELYFRWGIHSLIAAPLLENGKLIGYLEADNPLHLNHHEVESLLKPLSYFLASAINKIQTEAILKKYSFFDGLTGLGNRNRYLRDLNQLTDIVPRQMGVIYIDLNGLKEINDRFGHAEGDAALSNAARIIRDVLPEEQAYRIGGDEFVALCPEMSRKEFYDRVEQIKNGFILCGGLSASMGVRWSGEGCDVCRMVSEADELMYEDKKQYYRTNPPTARYRYSVDDVVGLASPEQLEQAIRENRMLLYLQPKVSFLDRKLTGAEALVRYKSPDGAIVAPDSFIPALEEMRLIDRVDFLIYENTCRLLHDILSRKGTPVPISVNFSRYTLLKKDFLEKLKGIWQKYDIPQNLVEIEITESVENVDGGSLLRIIQEIRDAGFSVAIDDFGVKYANLALLKSVDLNTLKLDKSLLNELETSKKACILIQSLAQICRSMHVELVVEGVETEEQFKILRGLKCDVAQGYLFSKPLPLKDFFDWAGSRPETAEDPPEPLE